MKRISPLFLSVLLTLSLLSACGTSDSPSSGAGEDNAENLADTNGPETQEGDRLSVVSTIFPAFDFTREIAGEYVDLIMLLPPGAESHSFEPTTRDIITISECDVFIYVGGDSEAWVDGILDSIDTSDMTIISMMDLVDIVNEETVEGMQLEHESEEVEYDEHVWTSPVNAMTISRSLCDALCTLDLQNADIYRENCSAYLLRLQALDDEFRKIRESAVRTTLIFGDRFPFRYFVEEYDLDYYAAFPGCSSDTEPSAKTVAFLIDKTGEEKIPVVFYIEFSNEKMADTICESTGAKKLLLHSCHSVTKDDLEAGVSYLDLMWQNAENLREALS